MTAQPWADYDREPDLTLTLDSDEKWINANARTHWAVKAKLTRYWRELTAFSVAVHEQRANRVALSRAHVVVTYHRRDRRAFDPSNLAPTSKACLDGLVDAGVVPDDTHRHVIGPDERYGEPGQRRIVIDVYRLDPTEEMKP